MRLPHRNRLAVVSSLAFLAFAATTALAGSFPSSSALTIPDASAPGSVGSAAPSSVSVSGESIVTRLTVKLFGFTHSAPDDVDLLLVAPNGQSVVLMSDTGGDSSAFGHDGRPTVNVSGVNLTFDDGAGQYLPDEGEIVDGTYRPTNRSSSLSCPSEPATDVFPLAPAGSPGSALTDFDGVDPNGTWTLYAVDDCTGFTGALQNGWSLGVNITTAVGVEGFLARPLAGRVGLAWHTSTESHVLGFNVYRSVPGAEATKVNRVLIAAHAPGTTAGSAYRFTDAAALRGHSYTYRLQVVRSNGAHSWVGAAAVRAR